MKKLLLTTTLCAAFTMPVMAGARSFAHLDTDRDGQLSRAELEVGYGAGDAVQVLDMQDVDGDGHITRDEARQTAGNARPNDVAGEAPADRPGGHRTDDAVSADRLAAGAAGNAVAGDQIATATTMSVAGPSFDDSGSAIGATAGQLDVADQTEGDLFSIGDAVLAETEVGNPGNSWTDEGEPGFRPDVPAPDDELVGGVVSEGDASVVETDGGTSL